MHYSPDTFAVRGTNAIVASSPGIHIGRAEELSPLDVAKANALYKCSTRPLPPPSVVVPDETITKLPNGITCGTVTKVNGRGIVRSQRYPAALHNQDCAFVLEAPKGYGFSVSFPDFRLDPT